MKKRSRATAPPQLSTKPVHLLDLADSDGSGLMLFVDDVPDPHLDLTVADLLLAAVGRNATGLEDPEPGTGKYRSSARTFACLVKGWPGFRQLGPSQAVAAIEKLIFKAMRLPDSEDPWAAIGLGKLDLHGKESDPRISFSDQWQSAEPLPWAWGRHEAAELLAARHLLSSPMLGVRDATYLRSISLAYWLSRCSFAAVISHDPALFHLSCRKAAQFAGVSHPAAAEHLRRAQGDELIHPVGKPTRDLAQHYLFYEGRVSLNVIRS